MPASTSGRIAPRAGAWRPQVVRERDSERILGAEILAPNGGEVAAVIQMAMLGNLPAAALRDAMLAHATMAEGLNALFASCVD